MSDRLLTPQEVAFINAQSILAALAYGKADKQRWVVARRCYKVVGRYIAGASAIMARNMACSVDTVEDHAHAYEMFVTLYNHQDQDGEYPYRAGVKIARALPFIYYSHFRALYDAWKKYDLSLAQVASLLLDIIQAEGDISSRNIDMHTAQKYGNEVAWTYHARRLMKPLLSVRMAPDTPAAIRRMATDLFESIGNEA